MLWIIEEYPVTIIIYHCLQLYVLYGLIEIILYLFEDLIDKKYFFWNNITILSVANINPLTMQNFLNGIIHLTFLELSIIILGVTRWELEYKKKEPLKKAQINKIANVVGSVWLSLFMDGSVKCEVDQCLVRLHGCAGWSDSMLVAKAIHFRQDKG